MEVFFSFCLTMTVLLGINLVSVSVHQHIFKNRIDYWSRFYIGFVLITTTVVWFIYIIMWIWV
jgi:hypothetical protein